MRRTLLISSLFALVFVLINLRYLSKSVDWDTATYAHNIEGGQLREVFFNAHHVAFESSGLAWMRMVRTFWSDAPLYFSLRLRMLLWSAVFIVLIAASITRLYGDVIGAYLVAAAVAFSEAFWFNSQENETAIPHIFFQTALYFLAVAGMRTGFTFHRLFLCAIVQALSIAFHQADALYIFTIPIALLASPTASLGRRMLAGFAYASAVTIFVTLGYLYIAMMIHAYRFEDMSVIKWIVAYMTLGSWGLPVGLPQKILWTWDGIGEAFLVELGAVKHLRVDFSHFLSPDAAPYNFVSAFWIGVLALGVLAARRLWRRHRPELLLLSLWVIPTVLFFGWWEPYHFEYWLGLVVAMWLFSYLVFSVLFPDVFSHTGRAVTRTAYAMVILVLFTTNLRLSIEPRSRYFYFSGASWAEGTLQRIKEENTRVYHDR